MGLDAASLRIAFGVMTFTLGLLFYFSSYRRTRSAYSVWWCIALLLFLAGSAAFLLDGTWHQRWANPLGNVLLVSGAASVWAAARSLGTNRPKAWMLSVGPVVTLVASTLEDPATNEWSGGAVFLASMCLLIGLASRELWRLEPGYSTERIPMAVAAGFLAMYYLGRLITYLIQGPDGTVFVTFFGSSVTTIITMVLLVVVSFSMAGLSIEQQTRALRTVAMRDGLTGLLNRGAFLEKASAELHRLRDNTTPGALILADLDHFKAVNDTYGHAAGDVALQAFADACRASVHPTDLIGRYGGEEFVLLIAGANPYRAENIAAAISQHFADSPAPGGVQMPTVSYGIASIDSKTGYVEELIASADAALYQAKSLGRNRTVRGTG
ncbi:GGDEF domain-containing protein [Arthrobacter sp. ISL-30]|uniref:GGDEF domain-containing protein n=1 Tax=Arthrobacter sp. ISL-30 TaxID=2819109 RepID=UPI001BE7E091|nr:GGDEF domain-containing protein [Arthrobacter sp. ISL-30]MBT2515349.1 GGDEF domain-containing protein [Arthrobacter sp. ISL-30]